jgi:uncharacterized Zn finger protein
MKTPIQTPRNVVQVKQLQQASRRLRVVAIDRDAGLYHVSSAQNHQMFYEVQLDTRNLRGSCSCAWAQHGGINCKHVLAALQSAYADMGQLSFWSNEEEAERQHRQIHEGQQLFATVRRNNNRNRLLAS